MNAEGERGVVKRALIICVFRRRLAPLLFLLAKAHAHINVGGFHALHRGGGDDGDAGFFQVLHLGEFAHHKTPMVGFHVHHHDQVWSLHLDHAGFAFGGHFFTALIQLGDQRLGGVLVGGGTAQADRAVETVVVQNVREPQRPASGVLAAGQRQRQVQAQVIGGVQHRHLQQQGADGVGGDVVRADQRHGAVKGNGDGQVVDSAAAFQHAVKMCLGDRFGYQHRVASRANRHPARQITRAHSQTHHQEILVRRAALPQAVRLANHIRQRARRGVTQRRLFALLFGEVADGVFLFLQVFQETFAGVFRLFAGTSLGSQQCTARRDEHHHQHGHADGHADGVS